MKERPGDQPLPVKSDRPDIQSMVIEDIQARRQVGIERYGTALQAHNGRDMLWDAYEEVLDLATYLRGCIEERDHPETGPPLTSAWHTCKLVPTGPPGPEQRKAEQRSTQHGKGSAAGDGDRSVRHSP
jgi:hypothetical protein